MGQKLAHMKPEMIEMVVSNPQLLQTIGMDSTTIQPGYTSRYDHDIISKTALEELVQSPGFHFPQGLVYDKKSAIQYNIIKDQMAQMEQQLEATPSEFLESPQIREYVKQSLQKQNPEMEVTPEKISEAVGELWKRMSLQEKTATLGAISKETQTDSQAKIEDLGDGDIEFDEKQEDPNNLQDAKEEEPTTSQVPPQGVQLNISRL